MKGTDSLKIIADPLQPCTEPIFPTANGVFQQENVSYHKARIAFEWFQKHNAECQLMSYPSHSQDQHNKAHLWCHGTSVQIWKTIMSICVTAAWTCGTNCLRSSSKGLWWKKALMGKKEPCQGRLQLFCGATAYLVDSHNVLVLQSIFKCNIKENTDIIS